MDYETAREILTEFADALPEGIFNQLDGGIILQPETLRHPQGGGLYIIGQYHNQPYGLGRYVSVYYGSFIAVHGNTSFENQRRALRDVLYHELTHHIESLAGDRSLEKQDEVDLDNFRNRNSPPWND